MTFPVTGKVMWIITFLVKEIFTFIQVDKCLSEHKHTIHECNYFCCYFFTVVKFHILSEDYSKVQSALSCIYDSVLGLDEKNSLLKIAITTNNTPMLKKCLIDLITISFYQLFCTELVLQNFNIFVCSIIMFSAASSF